MTKLLSPRRVYLVVESLDMSADQISEILRVQPDEAVTRGRISDSSVTQRASPRTAWALIERGGSSTEISRLVDILHKRIIPLREKLARLRESGCEIVFRVVLYHSYEDEGSRGLALDAELVQSLAMIGASIDIDQFILADE